MAPPPPAPTQQLLLDLGADVLSAAAAGACVAPVVAAVDKAVAQASSGAAQLWPSFFLSLSQLARDPVQALRGREFRIVWALYAGTYAANNACCSYETRAEKSQPEAKTAAIFCCNTALSLWKDSAFAKLFGTRAPGRVPPLAFAAWGVRDVVGMGVIFTLPPLLAPRVASYFDLSPRAAETACQVLLPMAIQPVVAPFHLIGYMVYNRPTATLAQRLAEVRAQLGSVVVARWVRGFPPYSLGAVANKAARTELRARIHGH
ncbi:hypothetical protein M885DRAFT_519341 [Pelagophyceae sp. CCMP2097]|nr:hypothetical protein M885DRAFT_519341 [Pelagophyceae sp. CCMP2097]|mmetsp:Transcript_2819/g.8286  ORF Transcript_2819/g.8286 Transcript_2819/m.8286 type:complete len:261 (-) Transcript_2819:76-858(-)